MKSGDLRAIFLFIVSIVVVMTKLPIRPPRVMLDSRNGFWKQIGMIIIGTTISLTFTLIASRMTENHQRAKDRRLSAMMVMSNIESFARTMDARAERMATNDSIAVWLLNKPLDELDRMPEAELRALVGRGYAVQFLSHDRSAENIFSNNIETWKNMGNVQFIDCVGQCFSAMNSVEEYWNKFVNEVDEAVQDIKFNPEKYEGGTIAAKMIRSERVRGILSNIHSRRIWLTYVAATMRYHNRHNMEAIGITEEEVMDFTDNREKGAENVNEAPRFQDFTLEDIKPDNIPSMRKYDEMIK